MRGALRAPPGVRPSLLGRALGCSVRHRWGVGHRSVSGQWPRRGRGDCTTRGGGGRTVSGLVRKRHHRRYSAGRVDGRATRRGGRVGRGHHLGSGRLRLCGGSRQRGSHLVCAVGNRLLRVVGSRLCRWGSGRSGGRSHRIHRQRAFATQRRRVLLPSLLVPPPQPTRCGTNRPTATRPIRSPPQPNHSRIGTRRTTREMTA